MFRRKASLGTAIALGAAVTAAPVQWACETEQSSAPTVDQPRYEQWSNTDAASGRINMHDVQQAFRDSPDAAAFEKRVNEIYEGDWLVLIRTSVNEDQVFLEGWEDLNGSGEIEDDADDQLFEISGRSGGEYQRQRPARQFPLRGTNGAGRLPAHLRPGLDHGPGHRVLPDPAGAGGQDPRGSGTAYRQTRNYRDQQARNQAYRDRLHRVEIPERAGGQDQRKPGTPYLPVDDEAERIVRAVRILRAVCLLVRPGEAGKRRRDGRRRGLVMVLPHEIRQRRNRRRRIRAAL